MVAEKLSISHQTEQQPVLRILSKHGRLRAGLDKWIMQLMMKPVARVDLFFADVRKQMPEEEFQAGMKYMGAESVVSAVTSVIEHGSVVGPVFRAANIIDAAKR